MDINQHVKPYAEFGFMNDKTQIAVAPSGLFQGNPTDPTGNGNFNVNCSNPLLSAQQASIICTPAQIAADRANPGSASANVNIGRRNVEGGDRISFWEHTNYRAVVGLTGEITDAWNYDAYGQYYYTTLFNSNSNYLNFAAVNNALQVTGTASNPVCISGAPCVPWNIFATGGVSADQLAAPVHHGHGIWIDHAAHRARGRDRRPGEVRDQGALRERRVTREPWRRASQRTPEFRP